jgi:hypothetical protein
MRDEIREEFYEREKRNFPLLYVTDTMGYWFTKIPVFCKQINDQNFSESLNVFKLPPIPNKAIQSSKDRIAEAVLEDKQNPSIKLNKSDFMKSYEADLERIFSNIKKKIVLIILKMGRKAYLQTV